MKTPGEVLVDIVHCVDYDALYSVAFVNRQYHNVAVRNAEKMAKRRNYELTFTESTVDLAVDGSEMLSVLSESQPAIELVLPTGSYLQLPERNFLTPATYDSHKKGTLFIFRRAKVAICVSGNGYTMISNDPKCFPA
ncbi:hypothetical protein AAVH_28203 [Aphelenchoides avenae]|nr:hypothetical protein AAVH_28203 [Aphelenchus avenae]